MGLFERIGDLFRSEQQHAPAERPGRNEPCWCGSGRKYKKCHQPEDDRVREKAGACARNCGSA